MLEAGRTSEEIAMAFKELIAKSGVELKGVAQALLNIKAGLVFVHIHTYHWSKI